MYGLLRPKHKILGAGIAGRVEAVGGNVKQFRHTDEVFGDLSRCGFGAFAEYVSAPENAHRGAYGKPAGRLKRIA